MPAAPAPRRPRIYLAGPTVFRPDAVAAAAEMVALCAAHGFEGVSPTEAKVEGAGLSGPEIARRIYAQDLAMLEACDALVAEMTPFRGPSMDVGTAFEMGYAAARGMPVVAWSKDHMPYRLKVAHRFEPRGAEGRPTAIADADATAVEDLGLFDNLMVVCAATEGGVPVARSFEAALKLLAGRLGRG